MTRFETLTPFFIIQGFQGEMNRGECKMRVLSKADFSLERRGCSLKPQLPITAESEAFEKKTFLCDLV